MASDQRGERNPGQVHRCSPREATRNRRAGCTALTPAKSATWWRHDVPAATSTESWRHRARRRQQLPLADRARHVVMIARVAERSGHAAAAGIEIDDRRRRDARQQRLGRRRQAHRSLMAMRVEQHLGGPRLQRQRGAAVRRTRTRGTPRTAPTASATTRARRCSSPRSRSGASSRTADRQLGSTKTMRLSAFGGVVEGVDVRRGEPPRLLQAALRDQRPAAADVRCNASWRCRRHSSRRSRPARSPDRHNR